MTQKIETFDILRELIDMYIVHFRKFLRRIVYPNDTISENELYVHIFSFAQLMRIPHTMKRNLSYFVDELQKANFITPFVRAKKVYYKINWESGDC
jgi:hypothetical protein